MKKNNKLVIGINEQPPIPKWILLAFQHVFAMFGATILVPILVNDAVGFELLSPGVTLIASGVGTLLYILCTKGRSPVYLGSSFAFITPVILAYTASGKESVFTALMAIGIVYLLVALLIKIIGKGWINKVLPPIIVGPMIMIIGLSLVSTAVGQIGLNEPGVSWENIVIALVSFLTVALLMTRAKGFLKTIPFLLGITVGYIMAAILGFVDFNSIANASFFEMPNFYIPFLDYSLNFGALLTVVPIALVTMSEHIGDHKVLSEIVDKDLTQDPGLDRTLMGDGIATFVAAFLGGPANTTYGENTSVVGITKVASVWVIGLAAIIAICFGFMGTVTAVIRSIPTPVLGGVSILLYGFIALNGLKILIANKVDFGSSKNVVIAATMLVLGIGGAVVSFTSGNFTLSISGMSLAAIIGIILNLTLPEEKE